MTRDDTTTRWQEERRRSICEAEIGMQIKTMVHTSENRTCRHVCMQSNDIQCVDVCRCDVIQSDVTICGAK